jgi:hypothetical protein
MADHGQFDTGHQSAEKFRIADYTVNASIAQPRRRPCGHLVRRFATPFYPC